MSSGSMLALNYDLAESIDPRIVPISAPKGTIYRYIPQIGNVEILVKQDNGNTTNYVSIGGGSGGGADLQLSNLVGPTALPVDLLPINGSINIGNFLGKYFNQVVTQVVWDSTGSKSINLSTATLDYATQQILKWDNSAVSILASSTDVLREIRIGKDRYNTSFTIIRGTQSVAGNTIFQLPSNNGTAGQYLQTDGNGVTSWVTISSSGADRNLSNLLSPTAINQHLFFSTTNTFDIGSGTSQLRNIFLGGVASFWYGGANPGQIYCPSNTELLVGSSNGANLTLVANGGTITLTSANPINASLQQIINVLNPTTPQGVATKNYVDTAIAGIGAGATVSLNNLVSTAVNADILPNINNSVDLGSSSKMFRSIYAYTNIYTNNIIGIGGSTSFDANNLWFTANGVNGPSVQVLDSGLLVRASNSDVLREIKIGKDRYNASFTIIRGTQSVAGDTIFQLPPNNGLAGQVLSTNGLGVTSWITVSSSAPLNSFVSVSTPNGYGAGTVVRRYSVVEASAGTDITYTDNVSGDGATFTINTTGTYSISAVDRSVTGADVRFGVTVDSTALGASIDTMTYAQGYRTLTQAGGANVFGSLAVTLHLNAGQVVRLQGGAVMNSTESLCNFIITRVN